MMESIHLDLCKTQAIQAQIGSANATTGNNEKETDSK